MPPLRRMTRTTLLLSAGLLACEGQPTSPHSARGAPDHLSAPGHDLNLVFPLSEGTDVLPGHGPATTLARERLSNPFVQELIRR